jgi:hypothetical protein
MSEMVAALISAVPMKVWAFGAPVGADSSWLSDEESVWKFSVQ